jgi:tetratricopeptide (TPR) repeat protein
MIDAVTDAAGRLHAHVVGPPQLEASFDAEIGHALAEFGDRDRAEQILGNGLALVNRKENPALAGILLGYLARDHQIEGMVRRPAGEFSEALRLIHESPTPIPPATEAVLIGYAANNVFDRSSRGVTPEMVKMIDRMLELGREAGDTSRAYTAAVANRAVVLRAQEHLDEAEKSLQGAVSISHRMPSLLWTITTSCCRWRISAGRRASWRKPVFCWIGRSPRRKQRREETRWIFRIFACGKDICSTSRGTTALPRNSSGKRATKFRQCFRRQRRRSRRRCIGRDPRS